jgi:hypothetical protein
MDQRILYADKITETLDKLARRVAERFPGSGLGSTCQQLADIARKAEVRSAQIARPNYLLRLITAALIAVVLAGAMATAAALCKPGNLDLPREGVNSFEFVQALDAGMNDVVLIGAAIFFLVTLETRFKRRRALGAIHELRSIAHIIDMHQLTKDPERLFSPGRETGSSPKMDMTFYELDRYLDYCTEMLSLVGKIAAVYVQRFDDGVVLASASEVESLTTGLSRKIWQKITILQSSRDALADPKKQGVSRGGPAAGR